MHPECERIDALQHLRNRKTRHVASHIRLGHAACGNAREVAAFIVAGVGSAHIGRSFVARDGFKAHIRKIPRHAQGGFHVAEAGCEDDLIALRRQIPNHPFGIRALWHVFHIGGFHFAAQRSFHRFAPFIVLPHPTCIGERCNIDPSRFEWLRWLGALGKNGREKANRHDCGNEVFVHGSPLHGCGVERNVRCAAQHHVFYRVTKSVV